MSMSVADFSFTIQKNYISKSRWIQLCYATAFSLSQNEENICEKNSRVKTADFHRIKVTCNLKNSFKCQLFKMMGKSQRYTDANSFLERQYAPPLRFNGLI